MVSDFKKFFQNGLKSKIPLHRSHVATLRCDLGLSLIQVSGCSCFIDINI